MPRSETPKILSTRSLDPLLSADITAAGLDYREADFIEVELQYNEGSFRAELNNPETQARVFTSKNAVYSLEKLLKAQPLSLSRKKNFTVGIKTTEMLQQLGLVVQAKAGNAISLAQIIARNKELQAVSYFCGDKSLDDLPEYLESKSIKVIRELVYHTELKELVMEDYTPDGIIFLSPSAVYSFFKHNRPPREVPCFCIGATTSEAVHFKCDNPRVIANEPTVEAVVQKVIEYYKADRIDE